jgi:hypothetical protein
MTPAGLTKNGTFSVCPKRLVDVLICETGRRTRGRDSRTKIPLLKGGAVFLERLLIIGAAREIFVQFLGKLLLGEFLKIIDVANE